MRTLTNLFLEELADTYDAEHRLVRALPKMAKAATCKHLRKLFEVHLKDTERHVKKLEKVFKSFGVTGRGKKCEATVGLLTEGDEIAFTNKGSPTINAALISAAQKVEHYEIASYGCLTEWAALLGNEPATRLLQDILDEEKAADQSLTKLARSSANKEARDACAPGVRLDTRLSTLRVRSIRPAGVRRIRAPRLNGQR
jgi:ferritin-like metal-binding protein YciE